MIAAQSALDRSWWTSEHPRKRAQVLHRIGERIRERAEELAIMESLDSGKPIRPARQDVETSAQYFEFYAGVADKLYGHTIPMGQRCLNYTGIPGANPYQAGRRGPGGRRPMGRPDGQGG